MSDYEIPELFLRLFYTAHCASWEKPSKYILCCLFFCIPTKYFPNKNTTYLSPPFYVQLYWRHESSGSTFGPLMCIQGKMFMSWHLTVKLIAASPTTGETRDKCIMSATDSMSTTMLFHQTNEAFIQRVLDDTMPSTRHTHTCYRLSSV